MRAGDWIALAVGCLLLGGFAQRLARASKLPDMVFLIAGGLLLRAVGMGPLPVGHEPLKSLLAAALACVLFHGGVELPFQELRRVAAPVAALIGPGLVVTALVVGLAAAVAFHQGVAGGLVVGVVLAPTDPAILIPVFRRLKLSSPLRHTIIGEAALNDAVAAILTALLASALLDRRSGLATEFSRTGATILAELAVGGVIGFAATLVMRLVARHVGNAPAGVAAFALTASCVPLVVWFEPSAYLSMFVAGVVVSGTRTAVLPSVRRPLMTLAGRATDLAVVLIFVVVGANLPTPAVVPLLAGAVVVVLVLVLVARPLTVLVSLLLVRAAPWRREEVLFLCWTRETGVMAVGLGAYVAATGIPGGAAALASAGCATVITLTAQASLKPALARRLRLAGQEREVAVDAAAAMEAVE